MKFSVIDLDGIYLASAVGLLKGGNEVSYFTPYNAQFFSEYSSYAIGMGFGLKKPFQFFDTIDSSDVIVNFGLHQNDMIAWVRKHFPNKPCWGAGKGAILEWDRWGLRKILDRAGLEVPKAELVVGLDNLRTHLKTNKDKYVKARYSFKGVMDTFPAPDFKTVETLLQDIEQDLGIVKDTFEFIVESKVDSDQEWGYDLIFDGNDYVKPYMFGIEYGKNCQIEKVSDTMPSQLQECMDKLKPVLKQLGYMGALATELKVIDKKRAVFLDFTARLPSPFGSGFPYFIDNWSEVVANVASKKPVKAVYNHKYVCTVPICSGHLEQHNTKISFDPKYKENIKFEKAYKKGEDVYGIKKAPENMIAVVANGSDTVKNLIKSTKEIVETMKAYEIDKNYIYGLDKISDILSKGREVGIDF